MSFIKQLDRRDAPFEVAPMIARFHPYKLKAFKNKPIVCIENTSFENYDYLVLALTFEDGFKITIKGRYNIVHDKFVYADNVGELWEGAIHNNEPAMIKLKR